MVILLDISNKNYGLVFLQYSLVQQLIGELEISRKCKLPSHDNQVGKQRNICNLGFLYDKRPQTFPCLSPFLINVFIISPFKKDDGSIVTFE